jgi:hypothetical protein
MSIDYLSCTLSKHECWRAALLATGTGYGYSRSALPQFRPYTTGAHYIAHLSQGIAMMPCCDLENRVMTI